MCDESLTELTSVFVDVFREEKHDSEPDIVGSDFEVTVFDIGLV